MLVSIRVIDHIHKIMQSGFFPPVLIRNYSFLIDVKNPSPEHGEHSSEDDQDSFRPSTPPLSHSSPSEVTGTSLSE